MGTQRSCVRSILFVGLMLSFSWVPAPAQTASLEQPSEDEPRLRESARLEAELVSLFNAKKFTEALPVAEAHAELHKQMYEPDDSRLLTSLDNLAIVYSSVGQNEKAEPLIRLVQECRTRKCETLILRYHELPSPGRQSDNEQRSTLLDELEDFEEALFESAVKDSPTVHEYRIARKRFLESPPPLNGIRYENDKERATAISAVKAILDQQTSLLGSASLTVDWTRTVLCLLHWESGDKAAIHKLIEESANAWKTEFGEDSPRANWLADYLGELPNADDKSRYWQWELRRWESIADKASRHEDTAEEIVALETVIRVRHDVLKWDSTAPEALRLAQLYESVEDWQSAEHSYRHYVASSATRGSMSHEAAVAMIEAERMQALSRLDPEQRLELQNMYSEYRTAIESFREGNFETAAVLLRKASAVAARLLDQDHVLAICMQIRLGSALLQQRQMEEARKVLESAEASIQRLHISSFQFSSIAGGLYGDLADCLQHTDVPRAKDLHQRSIRQLAAAQVLWSDNDLHWREISSHHALAEMDWSEGQLQEAWNRMQDVLEDCFIHREHTFGDLPEISQLTALHRYQSAVDDAMSLCMLISSDPAAQYNIGVAWKGVTLRRLGRWRSVSTRFANTDPHVEEAISEIRSSIQKLAALHLSPASATDQARATDMQKLRQNYSAWERYLTGLTSIQTSTQGSLQFSDGEYACSSEELLDWSARNPDVALVDYFEYDHSTPPVSVEAEWTRERWLLCFVLRKGKLERFLMGPAADVQLLAAPWIDSLRGSAKKSLPADNGTELRNRIWEPIEHLLDDAKLVVISPIGALTQLPFAALPGRQPNGYLVEDHTITYVSAMQLLNRHFVVSYDDPKIPKFLSLGGAQFGTGDGKFETLPGTLKEARQVEEIYRRVYPDGESRILEGAMATKESLTKFSSSAQYILIATHGFANPNDAKEKMLLPGRVSLKDSRPTTTNASAFPDLSSGLVLAQGNDITESGIEQNWLTSAEASFLPLDHCQL